MLKAVDVMKSMKRGHVINQLHDVGYYNTKGKSYKELKFKLALIKAMEKDNV